MRKLRYLKPEEISPSYIGRHGPYRIGFKELDRMMPEFSRQFVSVTTPARIREGQLNWGELIVLASIAKYLEPDKIFEFGTGDGLTTLNLAANTPTRTKIYTIDFPDNVKKAVVREPIFAGREHENIRWRITQIKADPANYSTETLRNACGFVFIDSVRDYGHCRSRSEKAFELVSNDGLIIWHDYGDNGEPGVTEYLNSIARERDTLLYWIYRGRAAFETRLVMHCNSFRRKVKSGHNN